MESNPNAVFALLTNDVSQKEKQSNEAAYANIYGTDNMIVIRFRTPSIYTQAGEAGSVGTTRPPLTDGTLDTVDTFSGVYRVTYINSKFENGKFIQELTCLLDPVININVDAIRTQIEQAIKNGGYSAAVVPSVQLPAPAPANVLATSKTQTIISNTNKFPIGTAPNYPSAPSQNIGPYLGPFASNASNVPPGLDPLSQTILGR